MYIHVYIYPLIVPASSCLNPTTTTTPTYPTLNSRLWRASSQAAKSDVTLGTFAVVADRLQVLATELESVESLLLDRCVSGGETGGDVTAVGGPPWLI